MADAVIDDTQCLGVCIELWEAERNTLYCNNGVVRVNNIMRCRCCMEMEGLVISWRH